MAPIFELGEESIRPIQSPSFQSLGINERAHLQRLLRDKIDVVAPEVLVIAEEFGQWTDSHRRIDLLGVDTDANLVVIELKRSDDGGHMELQAIRYAAMVSTLTAAQALEAFERYLRGRGRDDDAEQLLLEHLGWDELDEDQFGQDVRIVLVSADFSREITTAVMWLNEKDIDIRCVRIQPYDDAGRTLIDVQQIIPLPEACDYQVQVREKRRQERKSRQANPDFTRYDVSVAGELHRAQWKRNAILIVVKGLHQHGVSPEVLEQFFAGLGRRNTFYWVEEEIDSVEDFRELAAKKAAVGGKTYNDRRWHTKDGDLMVSGGRTYVFTNQWGTHWPGFMSALQEHFPQIELQFEPTVDEAS